MAALPPGVTLEAWLRSKGGAVCFPKQCRLVPGQEAQHPTGITGGSDGLLTHLMPGQDWCGPRKRPWGQFLGGNLWRWLWGWGGLRSFPRMALRRGVAAPPPYHLVTVLESWVSPPLKKGQHTPQAGAAGSSPASTSLSICPATWCKFIPPSSFQSRQPL